MKVRHSQPELQEPSCTSIGGDPHPFVRLTWTVQPTRGLSLAELNERLVSEHRRFVEAARANTKRLTGRDRL